MASSRLRWRTIAVAAVLALMFMVGCCIAESENPSVYIGYDPIRHDTVQCSKKSETQPENCRGHQAEPYKRACSKLEHCRGGPQGSSQFPDDQIPPQPSNY
ncbi:hypothetical protein HPP92_020720 [Vanilla planifolia]|uniref:Uncharacterized protein n=1 Tax=Vanilla planifolia TaxID=51239 RepID=A0A835PYK5_VANPL|nr:hypothetical protein HPP92_021089 [Vanilla planifolia]KAG0462244.1 hypothetical protein HPP92_020720 [Vanilla planifolia]